MNKGNGRVRGRYGRPVQLSFLDRRLHPISSKWWISTGTAPGQQRAAELRTERQDLHQQRDGIFFQPKNGSVKLGYQMAVGDFNGDGKVDVVSPGTAPLRCRSMPMTTARNMPCRARSRGEKLYGDARRNTMDGLGGDDFIFSVPATTMSMAAAATTA